jgi:hypothetical protein
MILFPIICGSFASEYTLLYYACSITPPSEAGYKLPCFGLSSISDFLSQVENKNTIILIEKIILCLSMFILAF